MLLTDVNSDCLEKVFEYLNLGDLLNVIDASKQLHQPAYVLLNRDYIRSDQYLSIGSLCRVRPQLYELSYDFINIRDVKTALQFLRCCGKFVSEIDFAFYEDLTPARLHTKRSTELDQFVLNYIQKYCLETLTKITFRGSAKDMNGLKSIEKPFPLIEKVSFVDCPLPDQSKWLLTLFPAMSDLSVEMFDFKTQNTFDGFKNIAHHFPHLERVHLSNSKYSRAPNYLENMLALLRLNPQLRFLSIREYNKENLFSEENALILKNVIQKMQKLETFHIHTLEKGSFYPGFDSSLIHFNEVKEFLFDNYEHRYGIELYLPFTFDQLESFTCSTEYLNEEFYEFIENNPTIKELHIKIKTHERSINLDVRRLRNSLPLLTIASFSKTYFTASQATHILNRFQTLKLFTFDFSNRSVYDELRARLKGWTTSIVDTPFMNTITLERK